MMLGNMGFNGWLATIYLGQYCCLISIILHIALITGPYLYNIIHSPLCNIVSDRRTLLMVTD